MCAADFAKLGSPQDAEKMLSIWHSMACLLGNPNEIADPKINEAAIRCLVDVWDMFAAVRSHCSPSLYMDEQIDEGKVHSYTW